MLEDKSIWLGLLIWQIAVTFRFQSEILYVHMFVAGQSYAAHMSHGRRGPPVPVSGLQEEAGDTVWPVQQWLPDSCPQATRCCTSQDVCLWRDLLPRWQLGMAILRTRTIDTPTYMSVTNSLNPLTIKPKGYKEPNCCQHQMTSQQHVLF